MKLKTLAIAGAFALQAVVASTAFAQAWPTKPVKIVNPFPAGGGTDAFVRPLATHLSTVLGQQFIVENLAGAGGTVGAAQAAKAPGDGYTILAGAVHHSIAETLYTKLPYNIEKDFIPVTVLAYVPNVVVVHPKVPANTLAEFLDLVKKNPGKYNFGSAGNGTSHHLTVEMFKQMTGTQMTHVPYKGAGPMMQDLLAGQVDFAFDGMGTSAAQIKGGKLRPLAVTSAKRNPVVPDTPTLDEAGIKGYEATTWYAFWVPKGTPPEIVAKLQAETAKALNDPKMKEIWASQGATAGGQASADMAKFLRSEIEKWGKVVKASGAKIDL